MHLQFGFRIPQSSPAETYWFIVKTLVNANLYFIANKFRHVSNISALPLFYIYHAKDVLSNTYSELGRTK